MLAADADESGTGSLEPNDDVLWPEQLVMSAHRAGDSGDSRAWRPKDGRKPKAAGMRDFTRQARKVACQTVPTSRQLIEREIQLRGFSENGRGLRSGLA